MTLTASPYSGPIDQNRIDLKAGLTLEEKVLLCALAGFMLLLRPSVFGEIYSLPVTILMAPTVLLIFINSIRLRRKLEMDAGAFIVLMVYLCIYYYVMIRIILFMPSFDPSVPAKGYIINIIAAASFAMVMCRKDYALYFFDCFAFIIFLSCLSATITGALLVAGISDRTLVYLRIPYTYRSLGDIAFPFTFVGGGVTTPFGFFVRMQGIWREPGVMPIFGCFGAAWLYLRGKSILMWGACCAGTIMCLSSVGAPFGLYTFMMIVANRLKIPPLVALAGMAIAGLALWQIIYTSEYFGLEQKVNSGSGSFEEREFLAKAALEADNLFFGDGFGFTIFTTGPISVIAGIRVYGLVYASLFFTSYILAARHMALFVIGFVPIILTLMMLQPVFIEPATVCLFFAPHALAARKGGRAPLPRMAAVR